MTHPASLDIGVRTMVTPEIAHQVLWQYSRSTPGLGHPPADHFTASLMSLISHASTEHRRLLARAYPGYVIAANLIEHTPTGVDVLRDIASVGPRA